MTSWVNSALAYVSKGDYCSRKLRERLNESFRQALGPDAVHPDWTVEQLVLSEIASLGCQPQYDLALLTLDWPPAR